MLVYDKLSDKFFENKEEVKPDHKDFMLKICKMIIKRVENGDSLADVCELESETYPSLASILLYIDEDNALSEAYDRAERSRLAILKEQVLEMADIYKKNPNVENKDAFTALEKLYTSLAKQQGANESVKLIFNSVLPDTFWDDEPPAPKHPRETNG